MRVLAVVLSTIAIVFSGTAFAAKPVACRISAADGGKVVNAMRTMYAALVSDDLIGFRAVVTPDFYAYDGGKRYDGDALSNTIKAGHAGGTVYVWTVNEAAVHGTCEQAYVTYVNRGSVKNAAGARDVMWLESAVLQKTAGQWRISFFHSTRVP
jgi:ketosteroid isomerase-like protein